MILILFGNAVPLKNNVELVRLAHQQRSILETIRREKAKLLQIAALSPKTTTAN